MTGTTYTNFTNPPTGGQTSQQYDSNGNAEANYSAPAAADAPPSDAETITVTDSAGSGGSSSDVTLSYAVNNIVNAAVGNYVITFASSADSIALSSTLDFTGDGTNVWIVGPASVNCSDGGSFSVSSTTTVNLSGLTISHQTVNGLVNGSALNVSSCTFSDNGEPEATYAAIDNSGVLTVTSSTFTGGKANDAGAIYNSGSATVASSTFSDNFAFFIGGAISNVGTMSVQSCTFEGNQTSLYGGAIYNASTGQLSVASCTISGNIATYGGGIYNSSSSSSSIANTIVADNTGFSAGPDIDDTTSKISAAHSLVKLAGSTHGNDVTATDGNVVGVDPDLDSLADNGAATETMALAADSPIFGAGIGADQTAVGAGNRLLFDGMYYYTYDAEGNRTGQFKSDTGVLDSTATDITIYTWNNADEMTFGHALQHLRRL